MKLRFDTYTKNVGAATQAFSKLHKYANDVTISKSTWQDGVINLSGEVDSTHVSVLEEVTANEFNEDVDKL